MSLALGAFLLVFGALSDGTYREEFLDELTRDVRATFEARGRYLELRRAG